MTTTPSPTARNAGAPNTHCARPTSRLPKILSAVNNNCHLRHQCFSTIRAFDEQQNERIPHHPLTRKKQQRLGQPASWTTQYHRTTGRVKQQLTVDYGQPRLTNIIDYATMKRHQIAYYKQEENWNAQSATEWAAERDELNLNRINNEQLVVTQNEHHSQSIHSPASKI